MFRAIARVLGFWLIAAALVAGVYDGTRSIARSELVLTPVGEIWFRAAPASLNLAQAAVERHVWPFLWDPVIVSILLLPASLLLAGLGLLLAVLGRRRERDPLASLDLR